MQIYYMTHIFMDQGSHSHQMAIVVLAVAIVLFDTLSKKRSVPLTKQSVLHVLKILVAQQLQIAVFRCALSHFGNNGFKR